MKEIAVVLSINGPGNVVRGSKYQELLARQGVLVDWSLPYGVIKSFDEQDEFGLQSYLGRNPWHSADRKAAIEQADALVVVNPKVERATAVPNGAGYSRRRYGVQALGVVSGVDVGLALGVGAQIFMPEGLPHFDKYGNIVPEAQLPDATATPESMLRFPGDLETHVSFIVSSLGEEALK